MTEIERDCDKDKVSEKNRYRKRFEDRDRETVTERETETEQRLFSVLRELSAEEWKVILNDAVKNLLARIA